MPDPSFFSLSNDYSLEDIAKELISNLDLESYERLLGIPTVELCKLTHRFSETAIEAANSQQIQQAGSSICSQEQKLAELVFEAKEQFHLASALYALAHDLVLDWTDPFGKLERLKLRFRLANALWKLDPLDPKQVWTCIAFSKRTLDLVVAAEGHLPLDTILGLKYIQNDWLGYRWLSLEEPRLAEACFVEAAECSWNETDYMHAVVKASKAAEKGGQPQKAYQMLCSAREKLAECNDQNLSDLFTTTFNELHLDIGGSISRLIDAPSGSLIAEGNQLLSKFLTNDPKEANPLFFRQARDFFLSSMGPTHGVSVEQQYSELLALILLEVGVDSNNLEQPLRNLAKAKEMHCCPVKSA